MSYFLHLVFLNTNNFQTDLFDPYIVLTGATTLGQSGP